MFPSVPAGGDVRDELAAASHPTRAVLPRVAKAGSRRIIHITSGVAQGPGNPEMAAHGVAKAVLEKAAA
jgi:3-oxoacyl-[acyl-carrier protein] reductase